MGSLTLAVLKVRQDFLSSSGGRVPHSLFKIIMKVTLLAAVVFLVYVMSGLTDASGGSEAKGPVVTHVVEFEVSRDGENLGTIQIGLFGKTVPKTAKNFFQLATQVQSFTELSLTSCFRAETSPGATELVASLSM